MERWVIMGICTGGPIFLAIVPFLVFTKCGSMGGHSTTTATIFILTMALAYQVLRVTSVDKYNNEWHLLNISHTHHTTEIVWNGQGISDLRCNGGYTMTCAISNTSQAYNAGVIPQDQPVYTQDQRGAQRLPIFSVLVYFVFLSHEGEKKKILWSDRHWCLWVRCCWMQW